MLNDVKSSWNMLYVLLTSLESIALYINIGIYDRQYFESKFLRKHTPAINLNEIEKHTFQEQRMKQGMKYDPRT